MRERKPRLIAGTARLDKPNKPTRGQRLRQMRIVAVMRDNRRYKTGEHTMNNPLTIPLVLLAAELGADTDRLAARLGDDVQVDAVGLRVVEAPVARHLFTERAERKAAEARRRAEWAERYRELDARMKAQLRGGIPATPGGSALADLMGGEQR